MPPEEVVDRGDVFEPETVETPEVPEVKAEEQIVEELQAKEEEKAPEPKKGDENLIPRDRFNEAVRKEREKVEAANARSAQLEEQLSTKTVSEDVQQAQALLKDLVKQRNQQLADGELEKAGATDEKILNLQDAIADRKADIKAGQAKELAKEEMRYDTAVARLEEDHPELDPNSDTYNQDMVDEVRVLMRGYQVEMGLTAAAALTRAAKRVFGEQVKAKVDDTAAKEAGVRRKAEAVDKNLAAAKKQPASSQAVGLDHDKKGGGLDPKTVMKMNYKEFSELSEDVLSRMRGDSL